MNVETIAEGEVSVVHLQGKLVAGVGDILLREAVNELLAEGERRILIDLSDVTHIDSSGVGELVASKRIGARFGALVKATRASQSVERVLRIAQILPLFNLHDTREEAIESLRCEELPKESSD